MRSNRHACSLTAALLLTLVSALNTTQANAAIRESTFNQVLDLAERVYNGEFLARNLRLQIHRNWERDTLRASASQQQDWHGTIAIVSITGGIARAEAITRDAFALIVCHEIGHHLAGAPHQQGFSAEGQADYFAASECLRRLLPLMPDYAATAMHRVPPRLERQCGTAFRNDDDVYLCLRIAVAGEALSLYLAQRGGRHVPDFRTPDPTTVTRTRFAPATPQCRLDTYRAAALCNPDANHDAAPHQRWLCGETASNRDALRPACWFHG